MKAVIMAAGKGSRISRHIGGKPKCTVDIGGITLIENTIAELKRKGISEIAIILGYRQEVIRELLKDSEVTFYYNPFYDVTNSIASLWFAKDFLDGDDILFLNGDVFFESKVIDEINNEKLSPVLFSDETRKEEADYKFYYEGNRLIRYGKELTPEETTGEYIGIAKIDKMFLNDFVQRLDKLINEQKHGLWWEDVLYSFAKERNIYVKKINPLFWAEVDFIEDYERIMEYRSR